MFEKSYLVIYDLNGEWPGNYTNRFHSAIETRYRTWGKVTPTSYIIRTTEPLQSVRDYLLGFLPGVARFFIVKISAPAAWKGIMCSEDWLRKNI